MLVHWLRDDYEQSHPQELESLAEDTQAKLANAIEKAANKPTNEFKVYPQDGSTANMGCQMQSPQFQVIPSSTEQQAKLESNKKGDEDVAIIK